MFAANSAVAPDVARLILQITAILGAFGALTPLIIFVLKRKTELRAVDATTDATLAGTAKAAMSDVLGELRADRAEDRAQIEKLETKGEQREVEVQQLRLTLQTAQLAIQTERSSRELLDSKLALLEEDLRVARLQIAAMHRRMGPLSDPNATTQQMPIPPDPAA
jgi:chromosome segregation ATPase